jgi:localization factor PodJL
VRNQQIARDWFQRAAEAGHVPSQYRLAGLFREGRGIEKNTKVALEWFQRAAERGHVRAMHNLAVMLAEGASGSPDYAMASVWFQRAAEFGVRDSQFNLAILTARGLGTSQDLVASYRWFDAAAKQGDDDSGKKRDEVGSRLSPDKLAEAKAAAAAWREKTPDPLVNDVAVPAGGWDAVPKQMPRPKTMPPATRT